MSSIFVMYTGSVNMYVHAYIHFCVCAQTCSAIVIHVCCTFLEASWYRKILEYAQRSEPTQHQKQHEQKTTYQTFSVALEPQNPSAMLKAIAGVAKRGREPEDFSHYTPKAMNTKQNILNPAVTSRIPKALSPEPLR